MKPLTMTRAVTPLLILALLSTLPPTAAHAAPGNRNHAEFPGLAGRCETCHDHTDQKHFKLVGKDLCVNCHAEKAAGSALPEKKAEPKPEATPEAKPESKPEAKPEAKPEPKAAAAPAAEDKAKAEAPKPEPKAPKAKAAKVEAEAPKAKTEAPKTEAPKVEIPKGEAAKPEAAQAPEAKAEAPKPDAKPATAPSKIKWDYRARFGALAHDTDRDARHSYNELVNRKNGVGLEALDIRRDDPARALKVQVRQFGTWNQSAGADLDYRVQSQFHVKAKYSRTDWDFGTLLDPTTLRDRVSLDATYDRSELKWRPRVVLTYRGSETAGDLLRLQANTDQYTPKDREGQTFKPSNQDYTLALFAGRGKFDGSLAFGNYSNLFSGYKTYARDMEPFFNGLQDTLQLWQRQDNHTRTINGKASYDFNAKYRVTASVDSSYTDNAFNLIRKQFEAGLLLGDGRLYGFQNQDHGWLDGFQRTTRLGFEGHPDKNWDVTANLERRQVRNRADGWLLFTDGSGAIASSDDAATQNKIDEGSGDFRVDYKGFKNTRLYAGFREVTSEELDYDQLGTFTYPAGVRTPLATTRAVSRYLIRNTTERMGYLGAWHRFNKRFDLDLRQEGGTYDDDHSGTYTGVFQQTLMRSLERSKQWATFRYRPADDWNLLFKFKREESDRNGLPTKDLRESTGLFANWTPAKRKYTLGAGYTLTLADLDLIAQRYRDEIESVNLDATYKFSERLTALADYSRTLTGDTTRLDYRIAELRLKWTLRKDREATLGYSRRTYDNRFLGGENFRDDMILLTYGIHL